jgi:hypothetical protein
MPSGAAYWVAPVSLLTARIAAANRESSRNAADLSRLSRRSPQNTERCCGETAIANTESKICAATRSSLA